MGIYTELKYDGTVNILMREYIKEGILAFGGLMGKWVNTPAKYNLFRVVDSRLLDQKKQKSASILLLSCCMCARG